MKIKERKNLVSFDAANFDVSEIYQGNVQSYCHLAVTS